MMGVVLTVVALLGSEPVHGDTRENVRVFPNEVSACAPLMEDCHLTLVDDALCTSIADILDPSKDSFIDRYNCQNTEEGVYICLNVLARRKTDKVIQTDYTDPHLLELAAEYERQLDTCLPAWAKSNALSSEEQSVNYAFDRRAISLQLVPFTDGGTTYDRLILRIEDVNDAPSSKK